MTRPTKATANSTRQVKRLGKAEVIWATPDEIDTETVRM